MNTSINSEDDHVIVTGAASGIGRATVATLLKDGKAVIALDRDADSLQSLEAEFADSGKLSTHTIDLSKLEEIESFAAGLPETLRIAGLVCSAARGDNTPVLDIPVEKLKAVFELNYFATFTLCNRIAKRMKAAEGGSIVMITSVSGLRANAGRAAYGSSKAAVEMLAKIMAVELAPFNIRVNTVAPGPTRTAMATDLHLGTEARRLINSVPQARYADPAEIAQGIAFLIDKTRSSYVTGHTLCVDGGMYAAGSFEPSQGPA